MDLSTIIGLVIGAICIGVALALGGTMQAYVDPVSMLIVLGGAAAATMTSVPLARFFSLHRISLKTVFHRQVPATEQVAMLVDLAETARRDGILALEARLEEVQDPFLITGIHLAIDGSDAESIEHTLRSELDTLIERHEAGRSMFEQMGKYAPAFGMIGTLIGLVAMLSNMDDPSAIGAGMAAALLTTLYGALLANLIFLPLADKLEARTGEESLAKNLIIEGVLAIQSGENPRMVESRLRTWLPPLHRSAPDMTDTMNYQFREAA